LAEQLQPAAVSPLLVTTTVQAAVTVVGTKIAAALTCLISASVRELRDATLRSLAPTAWRWLFAAILLVLILSSIGATVAFAAGSYFSGGGGSSSCSP
jgi:uncharacterized membrane protein YgcG